MEGQMTFEFAKRPTIKGYPELIAILLNNAISLQE